jgi:fucose permease
VASAQCALALAFMLTARSWADRQPATEPRAPAQPTALVDPDAPAEPTGSADPHHAPVETIVRVRKRETLALPAVWLGMVAFGVYVAIEVAAGLWAFLLLTEGRQLSDSVAGLCVSIYWASLFIGRVVQGVVAERLGSRQVLVGSLVGMSVGALLVAIPGPAWLAVVGLALIGFAAAPVFPLLTLTTADRVGAAHADRAIGIQIAGAGLGGALIPAGIGVLLSRTSVEALGPSLLVLSLILLALYAAFNRE